MQERIKPKPSPDETKRIRLGSCGWDMKMLGTWMDNQMNERLEPLGLSLIQFTIIMTLLEKEGLTQSEIGQRVALPKYAMTRHIDRLESLGYVIRKKHETSRRAYRILLTEEGRGLAPDLFRVTQNVNESFISTLEEGQKTELLKILKTLSRKLGLYTQD